MVIGALTTHPLRDGAVCGKRNDPIKIRTGIQCSRRIHYFGNSGVMTSGKVAKPTQGVDFSLFSASYFVLIAVCFCVSDGTSFVLCLNSHPLGYCRVPICFSFLVLSSLLFASFFAWRAKCTTSSHFQYHPVCVIYSRSFFLHSFLHFPLLIFSLSSLTPFVLISAFFVFFPSLVFCFFLLFFFPLFFSILFSVLSPLSFFLLRVLGRNLRFGKQLSLGCSPAGASPAALRS